MEGLFQTIILNSLNMTLVALLLMLVLRVFKDVQSPKIRYYSWLVVLTGFLIPVRFNFGKALFSIPDTASKSPVHTGGMIRMVETSKYGISLDTWLTILTSVYLLGVVTYLLVSFYRFARWKKTVQRRSVFNMGYNTILRAVANEMGIDSVELRFSDVISSPMMIGLRTPTILLPVRVYGYDELRLILKHEMMHFRHKDLWIKLFLIFCRAAHWFNPFMVLFGRAVEQECEYYCDMSVMEGEPEPMRKVYCTSIMNTLADQVRRRNKESRPVLATSFYSPKSGLKHRFTMILSGKKKMLAGILVLAGILTVVSGFVFGESRKVESMEIENNEEIAEPVVSSEEWVENTTWEEGYDEYTTWTEEPEWIEETTWTEDYAGDDWVQETGWEETTAT